MAIPLKSVSSVLRTLFLSEFLLGMAVMVAEQAPKPRTVIGIDVGMTYSCVGVYRNGRVEIIPNEQGNRIMPSMAAFIDTERLIGEAAKNQAALNPERTMFGVKRLIGRTFDDEEVQKDMKFLPYKMVIRDGKAYIEVKIMLCVEPDYTPVRLSTQAHCRGFNCLWARAFS